jgi:hypothetical protein
MAGFIVSFVALGLVRQKHLNHHLPYIFGTCSFRIHHHTVGGLSNARSSKRPLTLNLDHTRSAVSIGTVARRWFVTQVRNDKTAAIRDLPDCHASISLNGLAIQGKGDFIRHAANFPI